MPAQTIDEVIARLDDIIKRARADMSRLGFFATLYRNVTLKVKEGIGSGSFEDGPRMEQLDVSFANRYLSALENFLGGVDTGRSWRIAFQASSDWSPLIIQHLLLGMNAHINFDLGVAAAAVTPGPLLPSLQNDFNGINNILAGMIMRVRDNIEQLSPSIRLLDRINPDKQDRIINFSLGRARNCAWNVAVRLGTLPEGEHQTELARLDFETMVLAHALRRPVGLAATAAVTAVRIRESNDIPHIIDVLSQI
ncbi:MAG: DUF5995 family protein [Pyrinomonadaceae bacterium]